MPPWRTLPHLPLKRRVALRHTATALDTAQMIGQLPCHGLECEPRQESSRLEVWNNGKARDVPPHGEGLDESEELRPYQEPGLRGETKDGEML
jgi:hypothetical protein